MANAPSHDGKTPKSLPKRKRAYPLNNTPEDPAAFGAGDDVIIQSGRHASRHARVVTQLGDLVMVQLGVNMYAYPASELSRG